MPTNKIEYVRKNYKKFWWNRKTLDKVKARVQARRIMVKAWKVKPWDWLEVDHRNWTEAWNWKSNLRVISRLKNRVLWQKKAMKNRTHTYNKS